jgi:hypothetical protein
MKAKMMILPVAAMAALGGCTVMSGETEAREYALSGFDSIVAESGIDVVLTQGSAFSVKSEAPEGKLDRINIEQVGNELKIDIEHEVTIGWSGRYLVSVSAPAFTAIKASGGADVEAASLQADRLVLSVSGGADIEVKGARIGTLEATADGGGRYRACRHMHHRNAHGVGRRQHRWREVRLRQRDGFGQWRRRYRRWRAHDREWRSERRWRCALPWIARNVHRR